MRTARRSLRVALPCALSLALLGCPSSEIDPMELQQRYLPYDPSPASSDGLSMRSPPPGTIPQERGPADPALTTGKVSGQPVERIPFDVTPAVLDEGRRKFETVCGACHGVTGDSRTYAAARMLIRPPPSLLEPRIRASVPGALFGVISAGFGLMPGYGVELTPVERWGVVAWVRALQGRGDPIDGGQPAAP